jgi:Protein of unknown function (DUF1573)
MKRSLSLALLAAAWLSVTGCTGPASTPIGSAAAGPTGPQATVIGDTVFQAGDVEYGVVKDYIFKVKNTGGTPLKLALAYRSCQCAGVEVPESIAPDAVGEVKIRWGPIPGSISENGGVGEYTVTVKVKTDEPRELTFEVKSFIKSKVRVILPENLSFIDFGDKPLQSGEVYTREVKVFSPDLISFNLEPRCSIEGFNVVKTPLPPDTRIGDVTARSGYNVSLSTNDKLPPGYIHGELFLTVTAEGEPERKIACGLYANRSNIEFKVTPEQITFNKPLISEADSKEAYIQFTGATAGKEKLELVSSEPKWLVVSAPHRSNDKGLWTIKVSIPENNPDARSCQSIARMDGQIVLKSNQSEAPVAVRVKWRGPDKERGH